MATNTSQQTSGGRILLYVLLSILGLWVLWQLLKLVYYALSYLSASLFVSFDGSLYGQAAEAKWIGYALFGLGIGAAGGMVAAQRRFRLHKMLPIGAVLLVLVLCAATIVKNTVHLAPPIDEAGYYMPTEQQGQCPACIAIEASSTRSDDANRYTEASLLDKNMATAWISGEDGNQYLRLTLNIPTDQRLVGLRLGNGYSKSDEVFKSFSRVRACHIRQEKGPATYWTLPDTHSGDLFIPLSSDTKDSHVLIFHIDEVYKGENHVEVALSALTPVIEPVNK